MAEKSSLFKRCQEGIVAHGLWWFVRGDKVLDWLQDRFVDGWKGVIGSSVFATLSTWLIADLFKNHGVYLIWVGMGIFVSFLFVWDMATHRTPPKLTMPRVTIPSPPGPPTPLIDPNPTGKLRFGELNQVDIGPGMGNQAALIAVHNVEHRYDYKCHGIRAELVFTHSHSKETFKLKGWFASIHNGRIVEKPVDSLTLDSRNRKYAWLILYVRSFVEKGQYRFAEPGPAIKEVPVSDWTLSLSDNNRLSFGEWQVKIIVTSDGDDRLERLDHFHAE